MNKINMLDKITGCYYGVAIGDALGAAVEMMKPEDILAQNNNKPIDGFDHQVQRKQFKSETIKLVTPVDADPIASLFSIDKFKKKFQATKFQNTLIKYGLAKKSEPITITRQIPEVVHGSTTDDFQLTLALHKSLVRRGWFDITDIALAHVEAYETSTSGWGGSTRNGMKELQEYFVSKGNKGRSPLETPAIIENRGSGNGIAMKITPLALMHMVWGPIDFDLLGIHCASIGKLTHSDPRAWAAAYALACTLIESEHILKGEFETPQKIELLRKVIECLAPFERRYGSGKLKRFSSYLKVLLDESLLFGPIENLRNKVGTGCIAVESVVFAIALFLRNPFDFRKAVLEAVNSGNDADTNASMVGALIGSLVGPENIPLEWRNYSLEFVKAEQAAKEFCIAFSSKGL